MKYKQTTTKTGQFRSKELFAGDLTCVIPNYSCSQEKGVTLGFKSNKNEASHAVELRMDEAILLRDRLNKLIN